MIFNTPLQLLNAYKNGFIGSVCDKEGQERLLAESKHPYFGAAASPEVQGSGKGKQALLFKYVLKFDTKSFTERQVTGDCQNPSDLVKMADGSLKKIKNIAAGEFVISAYGNKQKVLNVFKKPYDKKMVRIRIDGSEKSIASTPDHEYIVNSIKEYKPIGKLTLGDCVYLAEDKNFVKITEITEEDPEENFVYCIEVENDHNFICNGFGASNCVSHAARNGVDITRSTEIINGDKESFIVRSATEGIYGVRGHSGQGMTCERAVRFLTTDGGILLRKKYESHDLSVYNGRMAASWGRSGTPRVLVEEARKNQVKTVSNIRSVTEARDALFNGYGIFFCSSLGFSSTRDKNGISQRSGRWMHAMSFGAMDDTRDIFNETLFLIINSWGSWNGGPKRLQQPDGSFWVRQSVVEDIIAQGSMWALSNVDGFPAQKIRWSLNEVL